VPLLEDRLTYIEGRVPSLRGRCDELVQGVALQTSQSGERQVRKGRGFGDANLRISCDHDPFCLDGRPAGAPAFRGKAGRTFWGTGLFGERASAGNGFGILSEQNAEHVLLLLEFAARDPGSSPKRCRRVALLGSRLVRSSNRGFQGLR